MKISLNQKERGGVLVTALIISAVMGVVLASFLTLTTTRNHTTLRSQAWNSAIPVLETGIEEALAHIHADIDPEANGWTKVDINGKTVYQKRRDLAPEVGYCLVTISNTPPGPVIYSRAIVPAPLGRGKITRIVRVTTAATGPFPYALLAKGKIQFNGSGYLVNSFNSEDANYSTNGHFIMSKATGNAHVLTILGMPNAIDVGGVQIFGDVGTGAGGSVSLGNNGSVGDTSWVTNSINNGKIQEGHFKDDVNITIDDVTLPTGGRWFPLLANVAVAGTNYAYVLTGGEYKQDNISLSGKSVMYVSGDSSLHVPGNFSLSGSATIYIAPNSSLKVYVGGAANIGGGGIINTTGYAKNLSVLGLNSCTSVKYTGASDFIGVINAPHAALTFTGGASLVGAAIGDNLVLNGSGYFIYDEALAGGAAKFTITSYREL